MNSFSRLLRLFSSGSQPAAAPGAAPAPAPPAASDALTRARELARAGRDAEACDLYWKVKGKALTLDVLVEHAQLLLALGNEFDAATRVGRVLELDPTNATAKSIQRELLRREDSGR